MVKLSTAFSRDLLAAQQLDAMLWTDLANVRYLCGFTGSDGVLLSTAEQSWFLTDSRYTTQAQGQVTADQVREYRVKTDGICELLTELGLPRVGFEAAQLSYAAVQELRAKTADRVTWVPVDEVLQPLRGCKSAEELAALEEATRLSADAFEEILPQIKPGAVERDIALALEFALKRRGAEEKSFDFIVASGPRGAFPHGVASQRKIQAGELVTIDFGGRCRGYHSDETVTLAVGEVAPRLREIYDLVLEAHDRALAAVRPGVTLRELDAIARSHIAEHGYGDYFGHGLGHGVGLKVHEYPTVSTRSEAVAQPGMVFTIEPGIYLSELGGVRIEDMVLVTEDGSRTLTRIPKEFRILPA